MSTGLVLKAVSPVPSWPLLFAPQHLMPPPVMSAHECKPPMAMTMSVAEPPVEPETHEVAPAATSQARKPHQWVKRIQGIRGYQEHSFQYLTPGPVERGGTLTGGAAGALHQLSMSTIQHQQARLRRNSLVCSLFQHSVVLQTLYRELF